jgi:hypothetical protein
MSSAEFQAQFGSVKQAASRPAIRVPKPRMTKTEAEYERILHTQFPASMGFVVQFEGLSFRLPSGTRYTPDFVIWDGNKILLAVEVKGSYRLGSAGTSHEKFKAAMAAYPEIRWRYAQKTKDGWKEVNSR